MNAVDIITLKRDGKELTGEQISMFIRGVTDGSIIDYQLSAWLMAVFLNGMTPRETADLTMAMVASGQHLDLSEIGAFVGDKHSTGGVGDKTTLVVAPLVAAAGVPIAKMSGRGLGFSGGTIDKLEAISGMNCALTMQQFIEGVKKVGLVVAAQTGDLALRLEALEQRRERAGVQEQALAQLGYGDAVLLPQHQHHEVLGVGEADAVEQWLVQLSHREGRGIQRKADLVVQPQDGGAGSGGGAGAGHG